MPLWPRGSSARPAVNLPTPDPPTPLANPIGRDDARPSTPGDSHSPSRDTSPSLRSPSPSRDTPQETLPRVMLKDFLYELRDEDCLSTILQLPQHTITKEDVDNIYLVYLHFHKGARKRKRGDDENETRLAAQKRRERGASGWAGWAHVLRLKSVAADELVEKHLSIHGPSVVDFLKVSGDNDADMLRVINNEVTAADRVIFTFYNYTNIKSADVTLGRLRWLYMQVAFYYYITLVVSRGATGTRIGARMRATLLQKNFSAVSAQMPDVKQEEAMDKISQWSKNGKLFAMLCARYGAGCLLLVGSSFSEYIIRKECPREGERFEKAMAHLGKLRLREKTSLTPGANELGNALCEFFFTRLTTAEERARSDWRNLNHDADDADVPREGVATPTR